MHDGNGDRQSFSRFSRKTKSDAVRFPQGRPSQEVVAKRGVRVVKNTEKVTRVAVNAWCSVLLEQYDAKRDTLRKRIEE